MRATSAGMGTVRNMVIFLANVWRSAAAHSRCNIDSLTSCNLQPLVPKASWRYVSVLSTRSKEQRSQKMLPIYGAAHPI